MAVSGALLAALAPLVPLATGVPAAAQCSPPIRPRIAEVFYDAAGDDSGREFVEFYNPHDTPRTLEGARLQVGDGSGPGRWTTRWTGGPADTVPAGGRFVVGGALVEAAPKTLALLDLQNGPDAVRVVWPDSAVEVIGYGALEHAEYFCGSPAADVISGQSLARLPDDADLGANALDFRAAAPSPGRPNQRRRDAAVSPGAARIVPELPEPGAPARVIAVIENRGLDPLEPGDCPLTLREAGDRATLAVATLGATLAAAETASVAFDLPALAAGKRLLEVRADLLGDEAAENDADSLWTRIGLGPLQITEIQFHPASGEGEWVEVWNAGPVSLDLSAFRLTDRGGAPGRPAAGAPLAPESLAVLAQDRRAMLARFPTLDSLRVVEVKPWPSLNNSDDAGGVADVAVLLEPEGTPSDRRPYSAAGVPVGVPVERGAEGFWGPAPRSGGSPLAPPRPASPVAGRFEIEPRRLPLGGSGGRLRWDLPWPRARVAFDLYDLAGRRRAQVLAETAAAGRGEHAWAPRDVPAGLYLLVLRARAESGGGQLALTRPVRLEGP